MIYEAESGDFQLALTGETLISRPLSMFREEKFLELRGLLHGADLAFTHAEMLFHNYEPAPTTRPGGTYMRADPRLIADLQWLGIDMVSCANNHAWDFGENGVLVNLDNLDKYGLVHAGTGRNLAEASMAAYVETPRGRVALISATSSGVAASRAGEQRRDQAGRPGANFLRWTTEYIVDREAINALRRISENMGNWRRWSMGSGYGEEMVDSDTVVHMFDQPQYGETAAAKYVLGETFGKRTLLNKEDLERNLQWVSDARRMADWVIVTVHNHEGGANADEPSDHIRQFARAVLDAGADVFTGHGPHQDRGIEIYNGKPILYSLGDFMLQNDSVLLMPHDNMRRYGLGWEATPADFYDARSANRTRGQATEPIRWQSTMAVLTYQGRQLTEVELRPVDLGFSNGRTQQGRPVLATGAVADEILSRMQTFSKPFSTPIAIQGDKAFIRMD
ncbi:MAG: CapA family protein [Dehalococcoidia bacterium]